MPTVQAGILYLFDGRVLHVHQGIAAAHFASRYAEHHFEAAAEVGSVFVAYFMPDIADRLFAGTQ